MILQTNKNLEDYAVEILAENPNVEAHQIKEKLSQFGKKYTIQAIYKTLNKLIEGGVVVKLGKLYSLRIPWVLDLENLTGKIRTTYLESPLVKGVLPDNNKKEVWRFNNLLRLNDFWSQILLILVQQSEDKKLFGYNPHPWFHLVQTEQELQYLKSIGIAKGKLFLIIGGRTYLDRWAEKYFDKKIIEYSFAKSSFKEKNFDYINVIDDYIVTVKIDQVTTEAIDKLYSKTTSFEAINISELLGIFDSKVKASFCLEKNPDKALKIKKRFKDFFGLL
jgi:hypothetical protein